MRDYHFGNFLRELREQCGLSQYQLGMLVGVSDKAVSKWENGTSKPKSQNLYPLSEILGVSVDELLSCGYRSTETTEKKGVSAMKNDLWKKASHILYETYGASPPPKILNRYFSEYEELRNGDAIVFYDFLGQLAAVAGRKNEYIQPKGTIGSSFVAYLLGTTAVSPLEAHTYCPRCKTVHFAENVLSGWDLPPRRCSCGAMLVRDGQNLPFESLRRTADFRSEAIAVSYGFYEETLDFMKAYFAESKIVYLYREEGAHGIFVILPEEISGYTNGQTLPFREYNEKLRQYPRLMISRNEALDDLRVLCDRTGHSFDRVDFLEEEILNTLSGGDVTGIPEFDFRFVETVLRKTKPQTRYDLLQICGLVHSIGTWLDNAELLLERGLPLAETIAYREDVFRYVQSLVKMQGSFHTGLAYRISENTRRGIYCRDGMPEEEKRMLRSLGAAAWFADSLEKIRYLFPKSHGAEYGRYALILTWYKLHFPKEFSEIYKSRRE